MAQNLITRNDNILGGIPVFSGTRVPVTTLFDYLKANHPLDDFPTVTRQQAQQVLEAVQRRLQEPNDEAVYEPVA
jgi:uncharacterized protein (DUF433 family)